MSDLISKCHAIVKLNKLGDEWYGNDEVKRGIALSTSVIYEMKPKVEIIHCKDCKYHTRPWYCDAWNNSPGFPAVEDEGFCWMAERKEAMDDQSDVSDSGPIYTCKT